MLVVDDDQTLNVGSAAAACCAMVLDEDAVLDDGACVGDDQATGEPIKIG